MSQRKASQGWGAGRAVDEMELDGIQENLLVGFISRFPFVKDPWWPRHDFRKVVGTTVEEAVLSDPEALSALRLGDAPAPVQRVRLFLRPDSAGSPDLSQAILEEIQRQGGPFPDATVMWIDNRQRGRVSLPVDAEAADGRACDRTPAGPAGRPRAVRPPSDGAGPRAGSGRMDLCRTRVPAGIPGDPRADHPSKLQAEGLIL